MTVRCGFTTFYLPRFVADHVISYLTQSRNRHQEIELRSQTRHPRAPTEHICLSVNERYSSAKRAEK